MKSIALTLVASATLALLSACGGDGGDGGNTPSQPAGATSVGITSANQDAVARATVASSFTVAAAQTSDASAGRANAQSASRAFAPAGVGVADLVVRRAVATLSELRRGSADARARIAAQTSTDACGVSGTFTSTFDDKDNNGTPSAGDVITITFTQCRDSSSSLLNGALAITLTSVASSAQFAGNAVFQNLTSTQGALQSTLAGSVTLSETDSDTESDNTLTVSAGGLTVAATSSTYSDTIVYAAGMTIASKELDSPAQTTLALDGSFSATSIGGSVTLATLTPVLIASGASFPSAGVVKVTGAGGSTLVLTAINATQVQLQLDADGNGTVDSTNDVDWTSLLPQ